MSSISFYIEKIVEAEQMFERYQKFGHGLFLWKAYRAMHSAQEEFHKLGSAKRDLAEQKALIDMAPPELRSKMLELIERLYPVELESKLTDLNFRVLYKRISREIDRVIFDLEQVEGTSTYEGIVRLKKALRIDGDKHHNASKAILKKEEILNAFRYQVRRLRFRATQFTKQHPWDSTRIYRLVANQCAVSREHVGLIVKEHLKINGAEKASYDELMATLSPNYRQTRKKKQKAAVVSLERKTSRTAEHPWRR